MATQAVARGIDLLTVDDPVVAAAAYVAQRAFAEDVGGRVGLELELHLVRMDRPEERPAWSDVQNLMAALPAMPQGSRVTFEPGGQVELSTPPGDEVVAAVAALRSDRSVLTATLAEHGFGAAPLGADPARSPRRVNPDQRYAAMEEHFDARSCGGAGRAMMTSTAALQVNLDAGPATGWADRMGLLHSMVPMLVAMSSTSPYLGGRASGWHSMRQETWTGIDHSRSHPVAGAEPAVGWALYALDAPVMLLGDDPRHGPAMRPVTSRVTFSEWLRDPGRLGRRATLDDLDYHLTTLFPPVRPRGYIELRCIDSLPDRWWPAVAAIVATLADDPVAADMATELCAETAGAWEVAARDGLADRAIRRAVTGCVEVAANRAPAALRSEVQEFAELIDAGGPARALRAVAQEHGPLALLEEEARA